MHSSPNYWEVYDRLVADESVRPEVAALVEAALAGDAALEAALGGAGAQSEPGPRPERAERRTPGAFLTGIAVSGFRGIGPEVTLKLPPQPGLTLVVGRNGSGKSSLAEGLEYALTGDTQRWKDRAPVKEWTSGWRNLHGASDPVHLAVRLAVEGEREPVEIARHWKAGAELGEDALTVRRGTTAVGGLEALNWQHAVQDSRPILSYAELSRALERGPSVLFDVFKGLLGLEDVTAARDRVGNARRARDRAVKDCKSELAAHVAALQGCTDARAERCLAALAGRRPDLDALEAILDPAEGDADSPIGVLRSLASLPVPTAEEVLRATEALRAAVDALAELSTDAVRAELDAAAALEAALGFREHTGSDRCPVCETEGVLDLRWRARAAERITELRAGASAATEARAHLDGALRAARALALAVPPPPLHDAIDVEPAREAQAAWTDLPDRPAALAAHLEARYDALAHSFEATRAAASAALDRLHASWRPVRDPLRAWAARAREAERGRLQAVELKQAEEWIKAVEEVLRDERFAPIAAHAQATWARLRHHSNVDLARIELSGSATRRQVKLDVTIDGTEGVALGVMSQGELHALALSLFLPRLMRPDSPFRFVVIDDPVQAMDPAKVDGLARVLDEAARTHQVIVFTHDTRLPDAARRLDIGCRVVEVLRRTDSRVELRDVRDPVEQYLSDAWHVADHAADLGDTTVRLVVGGPCRSALEAALKERCWREQLASGQAHSHIEAQLDDCRGLGDLAALALFGDRTRGGELYKRLNNRDPAFADQFRLLKDSAHEPLPKDVDVKGFIRATERLTRAVQR